MFLHHLSRVPFQILICRGVTKIKKGRFLKKAWQKLLYVGNNLYRANRAPSLLTRLTQMFFRLQTNEKTTLCYSVHSHSGSNMATHTPVGVDVLDDPPSQIRRGSPRESTPICLLYQREGKPLHLQIQTVLIAIWLRF